MQLIYKQNHNLEHSFHRPKPNLSFSTPCTQHQYITCTMYSRTFCTVHNMYNVHVHRKSTWFVTQFIMSFKNQYPCSQKILEVHMYIQIFSANHPRCLIFWQLNKFNTKHTLSTPVNNTTINPKHNALMGLLRQWLTSCLTCLTHTQQWVPSKQKALLARSKCAFSLSQLDCWH